MYFEIKDCESADGDYIVDGLVKYNLSKVPKTQEIEFIDIRKKIVDENKNIIGGCLAKMYCWNVMYIDVLWIDDAYRKQGLGERLLREIEQIARDKKCSLIHLDTFDFQAKDFYVKYGYEVFGVLEDCPENHCRYYLKKKLK